MLRSFLAFASLLIGLNFGYALDTQRILWKGRPALLLDGAIEVGDTSKVADALNTLPAWAHGVPIVLLNSPGGNVEEALKISELFHSKPVHTVIFSNAKCASACGSILFIAGKYRTMEDGGLLGQHSCSYKGKPDQDCNDLISRHALNNGVSYGSVAAFLNFSPPEDMIWMVIAHPSAHIISHCF
jgi:hypothetical protein